MGCAQLHTQPLSHLLYCRGLLLHGRPPSWLLVRVCQWRVEGHEGREKSRFVGFWCCLRKWSMQEWEQWLSKMDSWVPPRHLGTRSSKLSNAKIFSLLFPWLLAITNLRVTLTFPFSFSRSSQYLCSQLPVCEVFQDWSLTY